MCISNSQIYFTFLACFHQSWKILAIYQFDMAVYTKIFVKFPKKFWPEGAGREFFLYASTRRGYYGVWQVQNMQQYIQSTHIEL